MVLSRESEYAVQALLYMSRTRPEDYISIRTISRELEIPFFYLSKILLKLIKANILVSHKGPKGGVKFSKNPDIIRVYEIIEIIDGDKLFTRCVLGLPACGGEHPCELHNEWGPIRENIKYMLQNKSLSELVK